MEVEASDLLWQRRRDGRFEGEKPVGAGGSAASHAAVVACVDVGGDRPFVGLLAAEGAAHRSGVRWRRVGPGNFDDAQLREPVPDSQSEERDVGGPVGQ